MSHATRTWVQRSSIRRKGPELFVNHSGHCSKENGSGGLIGVGSIFSLENWGA
jgi:hypothetical protein